MKQEPTGEARSASGGIPVVHGREDVKGSAHRLCVVNGVCVQVLGSETDPAMLGQLAGGKARGLALLHRSGVRVPPWTVLGTDIFAEFCRISGLTALLADFRAADDPVAAQHSAAKLRTGIAEAVLPPEIGDLIDEGYRQIGADAIAVRSSVQAEDGPTHSYAGQFDSVLNVTGTAAVVQAVRQCWMSAFSERSIHYAFAHELPRIDAVAVILQRLVPARSAGVMFTAHPVTGSTEELMISAVYGLGEGVVSGAVDADAMVVTVSGVVRTETIGSKDQAYLPAGDTGTTATAVPEHDRARPVLSDAQAARLAESGRTIAEEAGGPQDIEWALVADDIYFLQTRPITTITRAPDQDRISAAALIQGAGEPVRSGERRIWDNSNIIESFSGITSPLTYTTAADIYGRVYRGYAESLRVPPAQVRQTDTWTPVLLGSFHGRVYYNLLHWYRMVGIAPGYPLNRKVLEAALGVSEPLPDELAQTLRPFTFRNRWARWRSRALTTATYVRRWFDIDEQMRRFLIEFSQVYDEFEALGVENQTGQQAYAAYRKIDADLVRRWGPMMVLDALLLTGTGLMYVLTKLLLPKAPEWFLYAVVAPGADVESAEPAQALTGLAELVHQDPALVKLINTTPERQIFAELERRAADSPIAAALVTQLADYLDRYGYRSLDELKLETPDLREDPTSLFLLLRSALGHQSHTETPPSQRADEYLDANLRGVRRRIYERLRGKVSRCAAHRERLRFCRTRAFGMVKRMIRVMGRDLVDRGLIDEFDDVFFLTLQELRGCYSEPDVGSSTGPRTQDIPLRELVTARKIARTTDVALVAPARFQTWGTEFDPETLAEQGWVPLADTPPAEVGAVLSGTPSAVGVVEGEAVVVTEPRDVAGGVLFAYRTDPGWVAALPSAAALVIERGSPLTHVAIVARELGVPTVVQVPGVTAKIRTGMRVRIDGTAGTVTVLAAEEVRA